MNDAEIIKALECCYDLDSSAICHQCPLYQTENCRDGYLGLQALHLINRQNEYIKKCDNLERIADKTIASQKAEIERLRKECGIQSALWSKHFEDCFEIAKGIIKTEARKEFAERLKERICQENELYKACAKGILSKDYQQGYEEKNDNILQHIDNLVKEMAGDTE